MKILRTFVILFILTYSVSAQTKWIADNSHTNINFTVAHMVISEVTGNFREFEAFMEASEKDYSDAKITVSIKARSIDTRNERRDIHLRNADFFNADVDSIITFTSTRMQKVDGTNYKLHGSLTMRGISKDIVLDTKLKGVISTQRGDRVAFNATTSFNRVDWGLQWNRTIETGGLLVGENIFLNINIEFLSPKKES